MSKIQFGWFVPPLGIAETDHVPLAIYQQTAILPAVVQAFDSLWVPDHLFGFEDRADPYLESWTTLTWLAARFPTVRVGHIVLAVGFRSPALLAKMAATLQALSGGRFLLGIGAGWREEEARAYGYDFPKVATRVEQLDEAVQILRLMWTTPAPSFAGAHFHITDAYCEPRPVPPPPIMIGSTGDRILPFIARAADIWDFYHWERQDNIDVAGYARRRALVQEAAAAAGRDPATLRQSLTIGQARLPTSATESRQWLDHLAPLLDLGVGQFILDCGHVTTTDPIHRFAEEVIAPINQSRA